MVKVVVVNGRPGVGKTEFELKCQELVQYKQFNGFRENHNLRIGITSTVDFVKEIALKCGWDGTKTLENRRFLSELKDLLTHWNDVPYKKILEQVNMFDKWNRYNCFDWILFVDCREPAEIQKLKERLNATTVLIRRPSVENNETSNHADAEVFNYEYDLNIYNDLGLDELKMLAEHFIEYMKKEEVPHYVDVD